MNTEPRTQGTRQEARYGVREPDTTVVTLAVHSDSEESESISGVAADVSATGLRLAVHSPPPKDAKVSIHFCIPNIKIDLMLEGTVRWVQPKDAISWWVGCSLETRIPSPSLQAMATHDVVDRRQDARLPASCRATARWELSSDTSGVTIIDYSVGGCAFITDDQVKPTSDRVMLVFESEDDKPTAIPVRVIWSRDGRRFGCEFLTSQCFLQVRKFVESESQTLDRVRRERRKRYALRGSGSDSETRWRWIAIAALVLLAIRSVDLIGNTGQLWQRFDSGLSIIMGTDSAGSRNAAETKAVRDTVSDSFEPDV